MACGGRKESLQGNQAALLVVHVESWSWAASRGMHAMDVDFDKHQDSASLVVA